MKISLHSLTRMLVGKILRDLAYGTESEARQRAIGGVIVNAWVGIDESREDAGIWLEMAGQGEDVFVYDMEEIEVEDA